VKRWEDPQLVDDYFTLFQPQVRAETLLRELIEAAMAALAHIRGIAYRRSADHRTTNRR